MNSGAPSGLTRRLNLNCLPLFANIDPSLFELLVRGCGSWPAWLSAADGRFPQRHEPTKGHFAVFHWSTIEKQDLFAAKFLRVRHSAAEFVWRASLCTASNVARRPDFFVARADQSNCQKGI